MTALTKEYNISDNGYEKYVKTEHSLPQLGHWQNWNSVKKTVIIPLPRKRL
jgi:hypothetical protein